MAPKALARRIADNAPLDEIARDAVTMRKGLERCIVSALEITEHCLGTEVHQETPLCHACGGTCRFICQAAVDDRLMSVGAWYLEGYATPAT